MNKVIIISTVRDFRLLSLNNSILREGVFKMFNDIKDNNKWFLEVKFYMGTIHGVLDTTDLKIGLKIANIINNKYPSSTSVYGIGNIIKDNSIIYSSDIGSNQSEGFVDIGRYLDKLTKEKITGIFQK